jgi:hypothetical protein
MNLVSGALGRRPEPVSAAPVDVTTYFATRPVGWHRTRADAVATAAVPCALQGAGDSGSLRPWLARSPFDRRCRPSPPTGSGTFATARPGGPGAGVRGRRRGSLWPMAMTSAERTRCAGRRQSIVAGTTSRLPGSTACEVVLGGRACLRRTALLRWPRA